jgi:Tol biopolymer transport system component
MPTRLPDSVNITHCISKRSMALDGTIYFVSIDDKGRKRLFATQFKNGEYQQTQPLFFSDGESSDVDSEIAPDGSFLVFCSSGRRKDDPKDHCFFVKRIGPDSGPVQPMRYAGDTGAGNSTDSEPHLAPDHRAVYFSSDRGMPVKFPRSREQAIADLKRLEIWDNGNSNVWCMPIDTWLAANPGS